MIGNSNEINEATWKKNFAQLLDRLMKENKVSINRTALDIGIDPKTLRNYCDGKSIPSAVILKKLSDYFGVSTDYLVTGGKNDTEFSGSTISAIAGLMQNFDVSISIDKGNINSVSLNFNDKILSLILRELYLQRNNRKYPDVVQNLVKTYGSMTIYKKTLVDPATFDNIMEHEYVYHDLEDSVFYSDNNNSSVDDSEILAEIDRRIMEWAGMTIDQRRDWWEQFSAAQRLEELESEDEYEEIVEEDNVEAVISEEVVDEEVAEENISDEEVIDDDKADEIIINEIATDKNDSDQKEHEEAVDDEEYEEVTDKTDESSADHSNSDEEYEEYEYVDDDEDVEYEYEYVDDDEEYEYEYVEDEDVEYEYVDEDDDEEYEYEYVDDEE